MVSLLKAYFRGRLNRLLLSVLFFIVILISTHFVFEIFHELTFYEVSAADIGFFYMRELLIAAPIMINISFILSWVLLQNQTAIQQQQHASLMSGWDSRQDAAFAVENLCNLSLINFIILFYLNPLMNIPMIQTNSSEIEWLSQKNIHKNISVKLSDNQILMLDGIDSGTVQKPVLVAASDKGWTHLSAENADLKKNALTLNQGLFNFYQKDEVPLTMHFDKMVIPLEVTGSKPNWRGIDGSTLYETTHPAGKSELFWRCFLIMQPWLCTLPFYSQKVALRRKVVMSNTLLEAAVIFALSTTLAFNVCKLLLSLPWYKLTYEAALFMILMSYGLTRAWQRGSYA